MNPLKTTKYRISQDNTLLDQQNHITPEIRRVLEEILPGFERGKKSLIKRLNQLCLKYPKTPVFKNYLSTLYLKNGEPEQAYAVNRWIVMEHPDYLFGKVNLALELLEKNEPEKVPAILGDTMEISQLYPERKEFHLEEVIAFHTAAIKYHLALDEVDEAEIRVKLLQDLDPRHEKTQYVQRALQDWITNRAYTRWREEKERGKEVLLKDTRSHLQTTKPPVFNFPRQLGWLYEHDMGMPRQKLDEILQLEIPKLIEDLEKVLYDSIARYDFFKARLKSGTLKNVGIDFPVHALLLLAHFKSEKSLSAILDLLRQDYEYSDFWFGDWMSDLMENALYHCGSNQIPTFFEFLGLPNVHAMHKALVGETLVKIIMDSSGDRSEFIPSFRHLLNLYARHAEDENYADTEATAFLISDIAVLGYQELLPEIRRLFDLQLVSTNICGSYAEIVRDISDPLPSFNRESIEKDIFKRYEEFQRYQASESRQNEDSYYGNMLDEYFGHERFDTPSNSPVIKAKEPGRNDPCPCGSGKKYKKCCMNIG